MTREPAPALRARSSRLACAVVANSILVGLLVAAWIVEARWPDTYYRIIPEDEPVEWATFWAQILACTLHALVARRTARRDGVVACWYGAGISLFCFLVAGEEISWGQRLLGYQPSAFFLAHNVQLEANLHNLVRPQIWSAGIEVVIGGFGVLLPLLMLAEKPAAVVRRWNVYGPPLAWVPGFLFVLAVYATRPFYLCEEVVELAIGVSLALAAIWNLGESDAASPDRGSWMRSRQLVAGTLLALGLGVATTAVTDRASPRDTKLVAQADAELEALRQDFAAMREARHGQFVTLCNLQARLHSLDRERILLPLLNGGAFWNLTAASEPKRAQYLLDPWNMPYWISDQCDSASRYIMLFSFGPNRRRESTDWQAGGDDVATYAFHLGTPRPGDWQALGQVDQIVEH